MHRGPNPRRAVGDDGYVDARREAGGQPRQRRLDLVHGADDVRARLALNVKENRRRLVIPGAQLIVFRARDDIGDVGETHGGVVLVGDDLRAVVRGRAQLIIGVDGVGAGRAVEITLGAVAVGGGDRRAELRQGQTIGGELTCVDEDADRRPVAAADRYEAHTGKLGYLLRQLLVGELFDVRQGHGL